jgi:hypothetical protein
MSSEYENLLSILQERDAPITININTTTSAVRKGLRKAIDNFNTSAELLELPTEKRAASVRENEDKTVTVELVDSNAVGDTKFKPKFNFEIVGTDNGKENEEV